MMPPRETLNRSRVIPLDGEPADEAEHFVICPACGQAIDCRNLGDVLHHAEPGHLPISKPS